ncbi:MAG TPA: c-type cytochrome, partial [Bacteroidia bacterium]|nr:c-type cytochrome [Bacteroidia bacterium]
FHWTGTLDDKRRDILRRLVPSFAGSPPLTDYLTSLVTADDLPHRQLGLELIALSPGIPFHEDWTPAFEKALATDPKDTLLPTAISALRSSKSDHFAAALESICRDGARSADLRLAAADALVRPNAAILPAVADLAMEIAQQPASPLRGKALGLLASSALRPDDRDRLAAMLPTFSPVDWGSFLQLFRAIDSPEQATILAEALVASPALGNLDAEQIRKRFAAHPEALARIEARTAELETERAQRAGRIEALVETLANADAAAGANVFATGKGACIACHRIGETGGQIGPDLSTIGRIRTGRDIYESVLFPSESIARDFDTQEIALKSTGTVLVGLVREHSDRGLQLVDPGGQPHTIPRSDIASIRRVPTSLMPSGLDQTLSAEDLRDLVAYLLSLK